MSNAAWRGDGMGCRRWFKSYRSAPREPDPYRVIHQKGALPDAYRYN
jgi:hypothetical protein